MEPMSPETRRAILAANPAATEADIDEYESLLARRFESPPEPPPEDVGAARPFIEPRLWELYRKLFPNG